MKNKKQKMMIIALVLVGIVFATIGATYAFFNYSKAGTEEHTITSGGITFHYQEASQGLTLDDAVPMTDSQGMAQTDYFDFTITSKTMETVDIPYYITARRSGTGTNMDGVVKVYLTKVDGSNNETPVEIVSGKTIAKVSELGSYINNQGINTPATEKSLYNDKVWAGTENYTQKYRLRMWIDNDAQFIIQQEGQPDFYPYEGKTYTLKVNVYSTGVDIGKSVADLRNNTEINSISVGNSTLVAAGDTFTGDVVLPAGESSTTMSITVDTVNPNSTVQVTRDSQTGFINKTGIKKIATSSNQLVNLGTNNYTITVKSESGRTTDTYHLTIIAKKPEYTVNLLGNNITFGSESISVKYNEIETVNVMLDSGYYLESVSCTNGYTATAVTGIDAVSQQTVTINNNGQIAESVCTFITTPITYSITYNLNSGTQGSGAVESYNVETATFNLPTPTKQNYVFEGWFENSDFSGTKVEKITKGTTGNKVYYAKFVLDTLARNLKLLPASSTVLPDDGTADANMRFMGSSPNNYITFNGETWRIIGVFNIKSSASGVAEPRVKIMRNGFFASAMKWNSGGTNNWPSASINTYVNNWLSASAKTFVDDAYWHLGGYSTPSITAAQMYVYEHNGTVYPGNATYWIGKVGLPYASDYGFASSACYNNTNLIGFNSSECLNSNWMATSNGGRWESLLTQHTTVRGSVYYIYAGSKDRGSIDYDTEQNVQNDDYMRPAVYLKANVLINSGNGSSGSPYTIKLPQ